MVQLKIDGIKCDVPEHCNVIEAARLLNIIIPRFCYHKKLSVAANCRMCLVEILKVPKLVPACTVKVTEGMEVFTTSPAVLQAQKDVMEFLLINHPLDCPICDQGGECELQDISLKYGGHNSRFVEDKRIVKNENLGSLIETVFNRCILCTRCIRFGAEIAGVRELGIVGRGVYSRVSTYVERIITSGLSGNIIDLCPVGALTSKPFKFKARPWELTQVSSISPHDCVGSNLYLHIKDNTILRVVPKENEFVNEVWISDRDRFSYEGVYSTERLLNPMYKEDNVWKEVSWDFALSLVAKNLLSVGSDNIGGIISPNSTIEEFYLFQKMLRSIDVKNIDSSTRQIDFYNSLYHNKCPGLTFSFDIASSVNCVLLVGANIFKEQPVFISRLNNLANRGGKICSINDVVFNFPFPVFSKMTVARKDYAVKLVKIIKAVANFKNIDLSSYTVFDDVALGIEETATARVLISYSKCEVIIGESILSSVNFTLLYNLCSILSTLLNTKVSVLTYGTNAAGAWLTGCVPYKNQGKYVDNTYLKGKTSFEMFSSFLKMYFLVNLEPNIDFIYKELVTTSLKKASFVVCLTPYRNDFLNTVGNLLLPSTLSYETTGTFINTFGLWQTFNKAVLCPGNVKQTWLIFVALSNMLNLDGFIYKKSDDILKEFKNYLNNESKQEEIDYFTVGTLTDLVVKDSYAFEETVHDISLYKSDSLVRRADILQNE